MKVSSQNISADINLNRVSANSRTFSKEKGTKQVAEGKSASFVREAPLSGGGGGGGRDGFVIVDGRKLSLNARRGTYVNLIV